MVCRCRKRSWHGSDECEDSDDVLAKQFYKVRKLNSDLFSIHGVIPPIQNEIANRNLSSSQFLRLPAEIREQIYYHVFGGEQVTVGRDFDRSKWHSSKTSRTNPKGSQHKAGKLYHYTGQEFNRRNVLDLSILRVCRLTFMEAGLLPYKYNSFTFYDEEVRNTFERVVRPGKKSVQKKAVGKYKIRGW